MNTSGVSASVFSKSKLRANFLTTKDEAVDLAIKKLAQCPGISLTDPKGLTCVLKTGSDLPQCRNSPKLATAKLLPNSVNCAALSIGQRRSGGSWKTTAADCRGQCDVTRECIEEDLFQDNPIDERSHDNPGDAVYNGDPFSKDPTNRNQFSPDSSGDISGLGPPITVEDISGGFGSNFFRSIFSFF